MESFCYMMQRMESLQKEIETLQKAEPPESYSTDTITDWLNSIREAPTPQAIKLLVERIEVTQNGKKIDLRVESTLRSIQKMVAGEGSCSTIQNCLPILYEYRQTQYSNDSVASLSLTPRWRFD